jgi:hypothetical protein
MNNTTNQPIIQTLCNQIEERDKQILKLQQELIKISGISPQNTLKYNKIGNTICLIKILSVILFISMMGCLYFLFHH